MEPGPVEIYQPRAVMNCGTWEAGHLRFKVYGLLAPQKTVKPDLLSIAKQFLEQEVPERVSQMGESNNLGFIIIHPGETGLTISAYWWAQGSVLCQHNYRRQYAEEVPMDTLSRPAVACVWELALINAEQEAWRKTMMRAEPDEDGYLHAWARMTAA